MSKRLFDELPESSYRSTADGLQQRRDGGKRFPRRWRIKDAVELVDGEPSIATTIHLDQGGHRTPEEAVDLLEGDAAILRRFAGPKPKAILQGVEQCKTPLDATAYACAYPNQARSRLDKAELRVVAGNAVHLALGNPKVQGHRREALRTQPTLGLLRRLQCRQEPGPLPWELRNQDANSM